jgi:hypothetical protein
LAIPFSLRWRGWHANTHVNVVEKRADNLRERQHCVLHLSKSLSEEEPELVSGTPLAAPI